MLVEVVEYEGHAKLGQPSALVQRSVPLTTEGGFDLSWETQRAWKVTNPSGRNKVGAPVAYKLVPGAAIPPMIDPASPVLRRARVLEHPLWVTPFAPGDADLSAHVDFAAFADAARAAGAASYGPVTQRRFLQTLGAETRLARLSAGATAATRAQLESVRATGILTVVFDIAYRSFVPDLVGSDHILEANGRLASVEAVAEITTPGLTGALVQVIPAPMAILLDAASFVASAVCATGIRAVDARHPKPEQQTAIFTEIAQGLRAVRSSELLRTLATWDALRNFFGIRFVLHYGMRRDVYRALIRLDQFVEQVLFSCAHTVNECDLFLQIAPGTDLALLNGLLHLLIEADGGELIG